MPRCRCFAESILARSNSHRSRPCPGAALPERFLAAIFDVQEPVTILMLSEHLRMRMDAWMLVERQLAISEVVEALMHVVRSP